MPCRKRGSSGFIQPFRAWDLRLNVRALSFAFRLSKPSGKSQNSESQIPFYLGEYGLKTKLSKRIPEPQTPSLKHFSKRPRELLGACCAFSSLTSSVQQPLGVYKAFRVSSTHVKLKFYGSPTEGFEEVVCRD